MKAILLSLATAMLLTPAPVLAQEVVLECGGPARLDSIVEPWSSSTRTFANGKIRVVELDTGEPACCSFHLAILAPNPKDELGFRQCVTVSDGAEWTGFQSINLKQTKSSYDAGLGLLLTVPIERYIDGIQSNKGELRIRINQATGAITLE